MKKGKNKNDTLISKFALTHQEIYSFFVGIGDLSSGKLNTASGTMRRQSIQLLEPR